MKRTKKKHRKRTEKGTPKKDEKDLPAIAGGSQQCGSSGVCWMFPGTSPYSVIGVFKA